MKIRIDKNNSAIYIPEYDEYPKDDELFITSSDHIQIYKGI